MEERGILRLIVKYMEYLAQAKVIRSVAAATWPYAVSTVARVSWTTKKTNEWVLNKAGVTKEGTVRHRQSKEASILWSHNDETRELRGER